MSDSSRLSESNLVLYKPLPSYPDTRRESSHGRDALPSSLPAFIQLQIILARNKKALMSN